MSAITRVADLLIEHGRDDIKGCRCGWGELGKSHPEHVARVLDEQGLLSHHHPAALTGAVTTSEEIAS